MVKTDQTLEFFTFRLAPRVWWNFSTKAMFRARDQFRRDVARYVNEEIGVDRLVTVSEQNYAGDMGLVICVWFRGGDRSDLDE